MKRPSNSGKPISCFLTMKADKQPAINRITHPYRFIDKYSSRFSDIDENNTLSLPHYNTSISQTHANAKPSPPQVANPMLLYKYQIFHGSLYKLERKKNGSSYDYQQIVSSPVYKADPKPKRAFSRSNCNSPQNFGQSYLDSLMPNSKIIMVDSPVRTSKHNYSTSPRPISKQGKAQNSCRSPSHFIF
ncbi:unnamed protein product [Blepharisma stoltei]|uniref:Uncharacterized protein n=1 Tax=Blepharisma stoltei TaxID=1481888 RepID=A0AAU9JNC3_9CILI|nr:unnamed protein product [Blepharisma stoltei]